MLTILNSLPEGLLAVPATELHTVLPGPVLIHLDGKRAPAIFVSVLLHGNEDTGWDAVRRLLQGYAGKELPRALSLFVGNVDAAREGKRFLEQQPDYNRIWRGGDAPEHKMMLQIQEEMQARGTWLSVDIHNNTGKNPHYACVNRTDNEFLQLATLFSRTVVYFLNPDSVQSMAFAKFCPAVTVECGQTGLIAGIDHAFEYINACLHLSEIPQHAIHHQDIDLYHTVATVKIVDGIQVGTVQDNDVILDGDLEDFNFCELPSGTSLGQVRDPTRKPYLILDESDNDVSDHYFTINSGHILTCREIIPALITLDSDIIRKDCLCYLMERYQI